MAPSIEEALASIRSLSDLPSLIAALGHDPVWRELPPTHWRKERTRRACVVGSRGDFWWYGVEVEEFPGQAGRLARLLVASGQLGAVIALDPHSERLACAVALGSAPVRTIHLQRPTAVDLACLSRIAGGPATAFGTAAHCADVLGAEGIGDRFFNRFRDVLVELSGSYAAGIPEAARHELGLLQLTRVLFLYFVQSKGWLDGRDNFLMEEVDRCLTLRRDLHHHLLAPLFFGTLNLPASSRRAAARRFGAVPFLNGGLFEAHPLERCAGGGASTPAWRSAFENLFQHFHFAPRHGTEGAIDPGMLGRVFESVMEPGERHASGTYFTPPALVRAVLQEGFAALLVTRLGIGADEAGRRLGDPDPAVRATLAGVTVLDPAVGSGVFLVAALNLLAEMQNPRRGALERRRWVLRHCLFGVDRNPSAVRLAELRLWLELLAADRTERPERVEPLPNLDSLIRQGDSLIDPLGTTTLRHVTSGDAKRVALARRQMIEASGPAKGAAVRSLREAELAACEHALDHSLESASARLRDLNAHASSSTLFGEQAGLDRDHRKARDALRTEQERLIHLRAGLQAHGQVPWFAYPIHYADVFANGGFDLVVGNPPWVRAEALPPPLRQHLVERYRWWRPRGRQGTRVAGYRHQPDLSLAFLERSCGLARVGGVVAFVLPAKFATTAYAAPAREALATRATVHVAADLAGDARAVFEATTYPYALVASMSPPPRGHRVRGALGGGAVSTEQAGLGDGPWIIVPQRMDRVRRAMADLPRLEEHFACHLGVKTGLNRVFLDPPTDLEPHMLAWAIRGRDVGAFEIRRVRRLLWPCDGAGAPLDVLPARAAQYLATHDDALRRRTDWIAGPPWTLFRTGPACASHLVVWPDLARRLRAACLHRDGRPWDIPLNTCYLIRTSTAPIAHRLTAWLNAPTIQAMAHLQADPAASGFRRFNARAVGAVPLPDSVLACPDLVRQGTSTDPSSVEVLDAIAGRHLNLSPEDRHALRSVLAPATSDRR